ncbi:MAG TPA: AMP-binding protein, partial [Nevskiaceae bacterium]|nr:AMP-binding protein [Nevskiaceae bacterium]
MNRQIDRLQNLAKSDPEILSLVPDPTVQAATLQPGRSTAEIAAIILKGYAARPALGERRYEIGPDAATGAPVRRLLPAFDTISHQELRERVEALACAWRAHDEHRVAVDEFVCILGFTGIDFVVADLATAFAQAVTVPLQASLGASQLENILRDTAPATVLATISDLGLAARLVIAHGGIRSLVVMDYDPRVAAERAHFDAARAAIEGSGSPIHLTTLADLVAFGRSRAWSPLPAHPNGVDRMAGLIHSSGSTGTPKGVIIPERTFNLGWLGTGAPQAPMVITAFAPMHHFLGRHQVTVALAAGGTSYFTAKPDLSTIFEDIRLSRPTFLFFFPRVFELIHQHYQSEKVRRIIEGVDADAADAAVRAQMGASFLGDRLCGATIGSAPCAPEMKAFVADCFDLALAEGYGSTESGIQTTQNDRVVRPQVIDYKLRDVPELGYFRTDKPYPRGELLVKSVFQSPGFFKRPEETAALFDAEGYVITGDIMEERGPDHLVCVDRRTDVIKLSQAEFVAVGPLGTVFESGSALIRQIYLYGNSARSFILAVVVPDLEVAAKLRGHAPDEPELKALIRSELREVARKAKLRTFEVPRDFIVELEPFSQENGLLSSVRKRMRPKLKERYGARLEQLYVQ